MFSVSIETILLETDQDTLLRIVGGSVIDKDGPRMLPEFNALAKDESQRNSSFSDPALSCGNNSL